MLLQDENTSQPDQLESGRGTARLMDSNLEEIRRSSIDFDAMNTGGGAVPAADLKTRNVASKRDMMSRTMTTFSQAKYGSTDNVNRNSISPMPNR